MVVLTKKLGEAGDPMNLPPCHSLRVIPQGYTTNPVLDLQSPDCLRCIELGTCKPADPRYAPKAQGNVKASEKPLDEQRAGSVEQHDASDPGGGTVRPDGATEHDLGEGST